MRSQGNLVSNRGHGVRPRTLPQSADVKYPRRPMAKETQSGQTARMPFRVTEKIEGADEILVSGDKAITILAGDVRLRRTITIREKRMVVPKGVGASLAVGDFLIGEVGVNLKNARVFVPAETGDQAITFLRCPKAER